MPEAVNHPQHYGGDTTYEAIKVIEAWGLGFCLGNAVKYICRAEHKGHTLEDLEKALWYVQRAIEQEKKKIASDVAHRAAKAPIPNEEDEDEVEVRAPDRPKPSSLNYPLPLPHRKTPGA